MDQEQWRRIAQEYEARTGDTRTEVVRYRKSKWTIKEANGMGGAVQLDSREGELPEAKTPEQRRLADAISLHEFSHVMLSPWPQSLQRRTFEKWGESYDHPVIQACKASDPRAAWLMNALEDTRTNSVNTKRGVDTGWWRDLDYRETLASIEATAATPEGEGVPRDWNVEASKLGMDLSLILGVRGYTELGRESYQLRALVISAACALLAERIEGFNPAKWVAAIEATESVIVRFTRPQIESAHVLEAGGKATAGGKRISWGKHQEWLARLVPQVLDAWPLPSKDGGTPRMWSGEERPAKRIDASNTRMLEGGYALRQSKPVAYGRAISVPSRWYSDAQRRVWRKLEVVAKRGQPAGTFVLDLSGSMASAWTGGQLAQIASIPAAVVVAYWESENGGPKMLVLSDGKRAAVDPLAEIRRHKDGGGNGCDGQALTLAAEILHGPAPRVWVSDGGVTSHHDTDAAVKRNGYTMAPTLKAAMAWVRGERTHPECCSMREGHWRDVS